MTDALPRIRLERALRSVQRQHRELGELEAELRTALGQHDSDQVGVWLNRYAAGLRAHFALEEEALFPVLRSLDFERAAVGDLEVQHRALRRELLALEASTNAYAVAAGLAALRIRIGAHEKQEEGLALRALERLQVTPPARERSPQRPCV